jgi:hypothetical protein
MRGLRHLEHASQEEANPSLPSAVDAYGLQAVVVFGAVLLQVHAEVKQRLRQHLALAEQECDQQAADGKGQILS